MVPIEAWFVGGPLHGRINADVDRDVIRYMTIERPDDREWLFTTWDSPIQAMPVEQRVHNYVRRRYASAGHRGMIWVEETLLREPHSVYQLVRELADGADIRSTSNIRGHYADATRYAWGGYVAAAAHSDRPHLVDQVVEWEQLGGSAMGQYGSPEAMEAVLNERGRQVRAEAQAAWERWTSHHNGEPIGLDRWLDGAAFEQTLTGLTANMRWTPSDDPDNPDANRSHP